MQTPQQTASSKPEELASPKTKEIYSVAFLTNLHFLILIFFLLALFPTVLFPHHFPPSPIIRWHLWISIKSCFHASSSSPGFNCTPRSSVLHHRAWLLYWYSSSSVCAQGHLWYVSALRILCASNFKFYWPLDFVYSYLYNHYGIFKYYFGKYMDCNTLFFAISVASV